MIFKRVCFAALLISVVAACKEDPVPALPSSVSIQVNSIDLSSHSVELIATQPGEGINGTWTIESENENPGTFSDTNDALATFSGGYFDEYVLRWTLSNGIESKFDEVTVIISSESDIASLIAVGISASELLDAGYTARDLYDNGISVSQLMDAGQSVADLFAAGILISELTDGGVSVEQLVTAQIPASDLISSGISIRVLFDAGVSVSDFIASGQTVRNLYEAEILVSELKAGGITLSQLLDAQIPIEELIQASFTVAELLAEGVSIADLHEVGVSIQSLIDNGVAVIELFQADIRVGELQQAGVSSAALEDAGLIGELSDFDGNTYPWVKIGDQIWMAKNLESTHYSNGDPIASAYAYDDNETNVADYGRLYTWEDVDLNVCPTGWHVPTEAEWQVLVQEVVYTNARELKSTELWLTPSDAALLGNNYSGFNAVPAGIGAPGSFTQLEESAVFWTATEVGSHAYVFSLKFDQAVVTKYQNAKITYRSIRCLQDE